MNFFSCLPVPSEGHLKWQTSVNSWTMEVLVERSGWRAAWRNICLNFHWVGRLSAHTRFLSIFVLLLLVLSSSSRIIIHSKQAVWNMWSFFLPELIKQPKKLWTLASHALVVVQLESYESRKLTRTQNVASTEWLSTPQLSVFLARRFKEAEKPVSITLFIS